MARQVTADQNNARFDEMIGKRSAAVSINEDAISHMGHAGLFARSDGLVGSFMNQLIGGAADEGLVRIVARIIDEKGDRFADPYL